MGHESTANFYKRINQEFVRHFNNYPEIFISSIPLPLNIEFQCIIKGDISEYIPYLEKAFIDLKKLKPEIVVIPCNTVHTIINEVKTKFNLLSVVDATIRHLKKKQIEKVGILGTKITLNSELYRRSLQENNIEIVNINQKEIENLSKIIYGRLNKNYKISGNEFINNKIRYFEKNKCDAVLLACTELNFFIEYNNYDIYVFDTLNILAYETINKLMIE